MTPIRVTHEQFAFHEQIKAFIKQVYSGTGALKGEPIAITKAKQLLDQAVEMGLPEPMLVELQILISEYESEGRLPAHLRGAWYKGGDTPEGGGTLS